MPFLGESQQHTLREIGELLLEIRQLIDAQSKSIAKFGQQSLTEEAPNSLDVCSPQQSTWHTRPPDVQPTARQVSAGRWRPPPSLTVADIKSLEALEAQPYMRTEAPLFNGDDPLGWIFGIQAYFNYHYTDESVRLAVVENVIEQPASDWFHHYQQNNVDDSWEDFLVAVYQRFDPNLLADVSHKVDENQLSARPSNKESSNIEANRIGSDTIISDGSLETNPIYARTVDNEMMSVENAVSHNENTPVTDYTSDLAKLAGNTSSILPHNDVVPDDSVALFVSGLQVTDPLYPVTRTQTYSEAMESCQKRGNFLDHDRYDKENSVAVFEDKDGDIGAPSLFDSRQLAAFEIGGSPLCDGIPTAALNITNEIIAANDIEDNKYDNEHEQPRKFKLSPRLISAPNFMIHPTSNM